MDGKIIKVDFEKGKVEKKPNNYQQQYKEKNEDRTFDSYFQNMELDLELNEEDEYELDEVKLRSLGFFSKEKYYWGKMFFKLQKFCKFRFIEALQSENYEAFDIDYYIDMAPIGKKKYSLIDKDIRYSFEYDFDDIAQQIKDRTFELYNIENNGLDFNEILVMLTAGVYDKILMNGELLGDCCDFNYDNAFSDKFDVSFEYNNDWAEILYGKIKTNFEEEQINMPDTLEDLISIYCNFGSKYINTEFKNDFIEIPLDKIEEKEKDFYKSKKGMLANFIEKGKELTGRYLKQEKINSK